MFRPLLSNHLNPGRNVPSVPCSPSPLTPPSLPLPPSLLCPCTWRLVVSTSPLSSSADCLSNDAAALSLYVLPSCMTASPAVSSLRRNLSNSWTSWSRRTTSPPTCSMYAAELFDADVASKRNITSTTTATTANARQWNRRRVRVDEKPGLILLVLAAIPIWIFLQGRLQIHVGFCRKVVYEGAIRTITLFQTWSNYVWVAIVLQDKVFGGITKLLKTHLMEGPTIRSLGNLRMNCYNLFQREDPPIA